MKLLEYQGKELLRRYGIAVPFARLITKDARAETPVFLPCVLKSQVPVSDRKKQGGILFASSNGEFASAQRELFEKRIGGFLPEALLVEERIAPQRELYVSISYGSEGPLLALSGFGGSGITQAATFSVSVLSGPTKEQRESMVAGLNVRDTAASMSVIEQLWNLFVGENALLAEINPLFELPGGALIAGDAKIVLDDNVVAPGLHPFVELRGDIAIIASGGGASMLCLDMLMKEGGKPANYVEYSGNPPASVVEELTYKVLSRENVRGCWVVGGTANFTDLYETLSGFAAGLQRVLPKPTYPIVIRRDGPRRKEAFEMLATFKERENYNMHLYGPETSMADSARHLLRLMKYV